MVSVVLPAVLPDQAGLRRALGSAVLHHLVVALAGLGWATQVERFPDPENSEHLAHVAPVLATAQPEAARLAGAIPRRRSDRRSFASRPAERAVPETLIGYADARGAELRVVAGAAARRRLITLVTESASLQRQQAGYAAELARWTHRYAGARDGIGSGTINHVLVER
jgi:hypothetical protein